MNIKDRGVKGGVSDFHKRKTAENQRFSNPFVELEGVEPSSKRGSHTLSTCLSSPKFSSISRTEATNLYLIL